ncbi:hypothetical protein IWQ60_000412 [Tieghemiomyces parasiticus]|uniref:Uncharacterized protein n=1 Tax=Tieghemiomyces parasiticus TaxID=78921 RepID=A0A9W8AMQ7_9FUNG|nr:hypothetical protein IWQ60_000412 [Tieghemiomyces parasiticus]
MYENQGFENVVPGFFKTIYTYPDVLRLRGTVIFNIIPQVLSVTLFATGVALVHNYTHYSLELPNTLIGPFSVVLGLLLVFRSNNANAAYLDGRRTWSQLKVVIRNSIRIIWTGVAAETEEDGDEKVKMVRYLTAFAYATKHFLRREAGVDYDDLRGLLPSEFIRECQGGASDPGTRVNGSHSGTNTPATAYFKRRDSDEGHTYGSATTSRQSPTQLSSTIPRAHKYHSSNRDDVETRLLLGSTEAHSTDPNVHHDGLSIPSQILFHVNRYVYVQRRRGTVDPQTANTLVGLSNSLGDNLTHLERILLTCMPLAYRVHMKQSLYLYCCLLPFTLVNLGFFLIPVVTAVAFTLFGIDGIGCEIENPFGYDLNDLALDHICDDLREEVEYIINTYPAREQPTQAST